MVVAVQVCGVPFGEAHPLEMPVACQILVTADFHGIPGTYNMSVMDAKNEGTITKPNRLLFYGSFGKDLGCLIH